MNEPDLRRALRELHGSSPPDPARLLDAFDAAPRARQRGGGGFVVALFALAALSLLTPPTERARHLDEGLVRGTQELARVCLERLERNL